MRAAMSQPVRSLRLFDIGGKRFDVNASGGILTKHYRDSLLKLAKEHRFEMP
jgi:hypothetical protein